MSVLSRQYKRAKDEKRLCICCGWIVNLKNWKKGYRLCAGCYDALKGVNVDGKWGTWRDEPIEKTGEML
jgi:hypothetical protein